MAYDYNRDPLRYAYYLTAQYKENTKELTGCICYNNRQHKRYNKKRIYIENLNFYEHPNPIYKVTYCKKEYTAFNDILVKYYLNNYQKVWFKNEQDCILWRLKYGI